MKLTLKQKRADVVNVYEVKLTVHVHHQSEKEAQSYLMTTLQDWACEGKIIAGVHVDSVEESPKRFFVSGVRYPEDFEALEELK